MWSTWGGGSKVKRFELGHFIQSIPPIFELRPRLCGGPNYLKSSQTLEERRLPTDVAAVELEGCEAGGGVVENIGGNNGPGSGSGSGRYFVR
jgi:hypothetical protein